MTTLPNAAKVERLCGTAGGYNALGTDHRRTCEDCKAASRAWFAGYQSSLRTGTQKAVIENNKPGDFRVAK
jgi:hypothetical protein